MITPRIHTFSGIKSIARLHYLTQDFPGVSHAQQAKSACMGGVKWIQLRTKNSLPDVWENHARETQKIAREYGAKFIVNDNVELALKIGADGVHLGKEDMGPLKARMILGIDFIVGGTANTENDIKRLVDAGVDYIGL